MISPQGRVRAAWGVLILCVVCWPISAVTIFSDEPQGILGLSWLALILTALDIIVTTDVRREQDDGDANDKE